MRSNTEKRPGRLAPVLAALATVAVVLIFVGTLLWTFLAAGGMDTIGVGIMAVYVLIGLAVRITTSGRKRRVKIRAGLPGAAWRSCPPVCWGPPRRSWPCWRP